MYLSVQVLWLHLLHFYYLISVFCSSVCTNMILEKFSSVYSWLRLNWMWFERLRKTQNIFLIYCIVRNKTREGDNSQQSRRDQTEFFLQTWTAYQYCSTQHRHANYWGTLCILSLQHLDCLSELHRTRHGLCEVARCLSVWESVCACTSIRRSHQSVFMIMCDGEEYQPWLRRRRMMNASFTAGIPIRPAEGTDSGMGHFNLPTWVKEGLKVAWWL